MPLGAVGDACGRRARDAAPARPRALAWIDGPSSSSATPRAGTASPSRGFVVEGDRIVEADAPGLERPLAGLTLLEAAAVPGETLAADALANAIAPASSAPRPRAGRIAVAMSGGVDSAVALHRAGDERASA